MKLVFLGSGSAFTVGGNYQSNMYVESDSKKKFLIDCGSDVRHALFELGLDHNDIDALYISHLHADHVGGLEWLAFKTYFNGVNARKIDLFIAESLVEALWSVLSGGLRSIKSFEANLSTYFNVHSVPDNGSFTWENTVFQLFQTDHICSNFQLMASFGLMTEMDGVKVLITTDTKIPPEEEHILFSHYKDADVIFHDCETSPFKSTVHSHYTELVDFPPELKKKIWLYHYQPGELPDAIKDGFKGFVKKGQSFDFKDIKTY